MKPASDGNERLKQLGIGVYARFLLRRQAKICVFASKLDGANVIAIDDLAQAIDLVAQVNYPSFKQRTGDDVGAQKFAREDAKTFAWGIITAGNIRAYNEQHPKSGGESYLERQIRFAKWLRQKTRDSIMQYTDAYQVAQPEGYPSVRGLTRLLATPRLG